MFEEIGWPACVVLVVIFVIWGYNVHVDRENDQELRLLIVEECADWESPKECAKAMREALD